MTQTLCHKLLKSGERVASAKIHARYSPRGKEVPLLNAAMCLISLAYTFVVVVWF